MVLWSDIALQRNSGSGVSPTRLVSQRAATPPSHRADEPPSARAPGKRAHLVPRPTPMTVPDANRKRGVPIPRYRRVPPSASSRRPLTHALGHSQWPESSALSTHPQPARQRLKSDSLRVIQPPGRCGRVRAVRNSPSDVVACLRVVRRHTCSPVTRRSMRVAQTRGACGSQAGQPAPNTALKTSHKIRPRSGELRPFCQKGYIVTWLI